MKQTIAKRIIILRTELVLTQPAFAEEVGVSLSLVQKIEAGIQTPSKPFIKKVVDRWGLSESWLRDGTGVLKFNDSIRKMDPWRDQTYSELKEQIAFWKGKYEDLLKEKTTK